MNINPPPPLALIAGPTASGKSALALALAELTPATIINADSMQMYRDLRVVTARPTVEDEARIPHRLFGTIDGSEACSAARWAADATPEIAAAHEGGRLPVLVGGTGLYIRTLLDGIAPVPDIDPEVRKAVRAMTREDAYAALAAEDVFAAERLAPNDSSRVARALEVVRSSGMTLGEWQERREGGIVGSVRLAPLVLLPPREWLFARCDARFDTMFADGQDEVAALMARALDPALPVMRAIGVAEIAGYQRQSSLESHTKDAGRLATRQYAKRQFTWFRNQSPADWWRWHEPVNSNDIHDIVIKLHNMTLTA